jgi:hypothetical protein
MMAVRQKEFFNAQSSFELSALCTIKALPREMKGKEKTFSQTFFNKKISFPPDVLRRLPLISSPAPISLLGGHEEII